MVVRLTSAELDALFEEQKQSNNDTSIPATFLRVTVRTDGQAYTMR